MAQSEKVNGLKSKLENGEPLSEEEIEELRTYIAGLRATAEFLLQSAAEETTAAVVEAAANKTMVIPAAAAAYNRATAI